MKKLINFYKRLSFFQGAAFAVSLTSVIGYAANSIPGFFTFTSGSVISSSQVNSNFDKLANLIEANQSQVFHGTWNASTNIPDIFSAPPMTGGYYVVTTAGTQNSIAYAVGDWAIWNGTAWSKIQNISGVSSVFGRTGAVLKTKGDYVLNDLGDVNLTTAPFAGQILQYDGVKWIPGTLPTLTETDPSVMSFAKTALPTCSGSQSLKSSGSTFVCAPIFTGTIDRVVITNSSGELTNSSISTSQLNYIAGVSSDIQTQLNAKSNSASFVDWAIGGVQTIEPSRINLMMADRAVTTNASGTPVYSPTTATEISYISGLTSNLQSQLNNKLSVVVATPVNTSDAANKSYVDTLVQYVKTSPTFTGIGYSASNFSGNTGAGNSFVGANAGNSNTTGTSNTFVGGDSGKFNTTGTNNTALGLGTLSATGVKNFNTAIGANALSFATTGSSNTAVGAATLGNLTTGTNNTVIGKNAGVQLTTGSNNIILGYNTAPSMSVGESNIILGNNAGPTTGANNIIIGNSGANSLTGDNNVVIGGYVASLTSATNTIVLATAGTTALERMRIDLNGNMGIGTTTPAEKLSVAGNITSTGVITAVTLTQTSDKRLKKNIAPIDSALEKILGLRGVEFDWIKGGAHEVGLIAQEVEAVVPDLVVTDSKGFKSVKYANVVPLLIESTRQTDAKITALEDENRMLKTYLCAKDPGAPFCH